MSQPSSYTLEQIAQFIGAKVVGDSSFCISGLNTLQDAVAGQLSFLSNPSYQKYLKTTQASCVILPPEYQENFGGNKLVTKNSYHAFALATQLFDTSYENKIAKIHSSVVMGENCQIADDVAISANVVLGDSVIIGAGVVIEAGCVLGDHVVIEEGVRLYPNVTIYGDTRIGQYSIVHSQAVIGSDGFGFAPKSDKSGWEKICQLGGVDIGRYVEIGAATTIDRGALGNTVIADGVKLDNQIQIAHNVVIGENTAIAGATAIAGSTTIGKDCRIAGAVGVIGHLDIADNVHITAMTLVTRSITEPGSYSSGTPMNDTLSWRKNAARFNQLDTLVRKITKDKK